MLHPQKLTCPQKRDELNKGNYIFQPSIFRGYVSFQGGMKKSREMLKYCWWKKSYIGWDLWKKSWEILLRSCGNPTSQTLQYDDDPSKSTICRKPTPLMHINFDTTVATASYLHQPGTTAVCSSLTRCLVISKKTLSKRTEEKQMGLVFWWYQKIDLQDR